MEWVLASASPRRKHILESVGFNCVVSPAGTEETISESESAESFTSRAAMAKFSSVRPRFPNAAVIAADTVVVLGETVYGKPTSPEDAISMLVSLSARWHRVLTALVIGSPSLISSRLVQSLVKFRKLSRAEIDYYVSSGESMDKAGAYGLQGMGSMLVERIDGSCSNVAGFPLCAFFALVEELYDPPWTRFSYPRVEGMTLWP